MDQLAGLQEAWLHAVAALPDGQPLPQHLREARWLLEEYRVSLFAQQLGTAGEGQRPAHPQGDGREP